jgi:hypothetical protein
MKSKRQRIDEIMNLVNGNFRKKEVRLPAIHVVKKSDPLPKGFIEGDILLIAPPQIN